MNRYASSTLDATPIGLIKPFTDQMHLIVETMQKEMENEVKLLEGTEIPDYSIFRRELDEKTKKEPSELEAIQKEWKTFFQSGCLTTDLTQNSTEESNTLSTFAELFNQPCLLGSSDEKSSLSLMTSCEAKLEEDGSETDAMNVCCDCTVPMISELTDGILKEMK
jgi:hypothetical protein